MPVRSWDSEISYRKRIALLAPIVLLILASLAYMSRRVTPREIYKYVGWHGELELLPEITIVPDNPAPDAAPAPRQQQQQEETVALDVADAPGEFEANPPRIELNDENRISPTFDNFSDFPSVRTPEQRSVSYSDKYVILKMVKPKYPPGPLAEGIEGNVSVELLVNEKGYVEHVAVLAALGPDEFQQAALEAAKQFIFQPPTDAEGRPTTIWVKFLVKFRVFG
ncbi:MAG TPA: energy transducer TonB [Candidatus Krumholzibacteria bacterium]|nr:energy transducer TonB [Candidatus Krumholzibacteria bacterium]